MVSGARLDLVNLAIDFATGRFEWVFILNFLDFTFFFLRSNYYSFVHVASFKVWLSVG